LVTTLFFGLARSGLRGRFSSYPQIYVDLRLDEGATFESDSGHNYSQ
jgi:hypothetical protein